jgi:hypothetical protein
MVPEQVPYEETLLPDPVVYSFIHISQINQSVTSSTEQLENMVTILRALMGQRPTYIGVWLGSSVGLLKTLLLLLHCHVTFDMMPSTLGRPEPR